MCVMVIPGSVTVSMVRQTCYMCGAEFLMSQADADSARLHATPFRCQNGHQQRFLQSDGRAVSLEDRAAEAGLLRKEMELLRLRAEQAEDAFANAASGATELRSAMETGKTDAPSPKLT